MRSVFFSISDSLSICFRGVGEVLRFGELVFEDFTGVAVTVLGLSDKANGRHGDSSFRAS
jgi:hypothetical protein